MSDIVINLDLTVRVERRDTCWAASMVSLPLISYASTREDAYERSKQAMGFFLNHFVGNPTPDNIAKLRNYLDIHGVKHTITSNIDIPQRTYTYEQKLVGAAGASR